MSQSERAERASKRAFRFHISLPPRPELTWYVLRRLVGDRKAGVHGVVFGSTEWADLDAASEGGFYALDSFGSGRHAEEDARWEWDHHKDWLLAMKASFGDPSAKAAFASRVSTHHGGGVHISSHPRVHAYVVPHPHPHPHPHPECSASQVKFVTSGGADN
jgi:hypothetical protein